MPGCKGFVCTYPYVVTSDEQHFEICKSYKGKTTTKANVQKHVWLHVRTDRTARFRATPEMLRRVNPYVHYLLGDGGDAEDNGNSDSSSLPNKGGLPSKLARIERCASPSAGTPEFTQIHGGAPGVRMPHGAGQPNHFRPPLSMPHPDDAYGVRGGQYMYGMPGQYTLPPRMGGGSYGPYYSWDGAGMRVPGGPEYRGPMQGAPYGYQQPLPVPGRGGVAPGQGRHPGDYSQQHMMMPVGVPPQMVQQYPPSGYPGHYGYPPSAPMMYGQHYAMQGDNVAPQFHRPAAAVAHEHPPGFDSPGAHSHIHEMRYNTTDGVGMNTDSQFPRHGPWPTHTAHSLEAVATTATPLALPSTSLPIDVPSTAKTKDGGGRSLHMQNGHGASVHSSLVVANVPIPPASQDAHDHDEGSGIRQPLSAAADCLIGLSSQPAGSSACEVMTIAMLSLQNNEPQRQALVASDLSLRVPQTTRMRVLLSRT
eukprot:Opistho-2@14565